MIIAICDDCIEDSDLLKKVLSDYAETNNKKWEIKVFNSGKDFLNTGTESDMVLLDIEMPGLNGIETGRLAKKKNPELRIVMFTGAEGYGEGIFDIGAVEYICKPLKKERVIKAVLKVESALVGGDLIAANKDWMPFTLRQKDVQYIRAYNGYILLYCNDKEYRVDKSLKEMETELDKRIFLRIDKSLIINLLHVGYLTDSAFFMGEKRMEIAKRRLNEAKKAWIEFDIKYNAGRGK